MDRRSSRTGGFKEQESVTKGLFCVRSLLERLGGLFRAVLVGEGLRDEVDARDVEPE